MKKSILYFFFFILAKTSISQVWTNVGSGLNGFCFDLLKYHSKLYATTTDVNYWDGSTWSTLPPVSTAISSVYSILDFNDTLYVGGKNSLSTSTPVFKYNGSNWITLGGLSSFFGHPSGAFIRTLTSYSNSIIAGGLFNSVGTKTITNIARWDGTKWDSLKSGLNNSVYNTCVHNNNLIAAGDFTKSGSNSTVKYVGQWNGIAWQPINLAYTFKTGGIKPLVSFTNKLIIGNVFDTISSIPMRGIAVWDGISFTSMGNNIFTGINSFWVYNSELFCGASTNSITCCGSDFVFKWSGSAWQQIGGAFDGPILSMEDYGTDLYSGGLFQNCAGSSMNYVAKVALPISVEEYWKNIDVKVYPSPVSEKLYISNEGAEFKNSEIEITNTLGQLVLKQGYSACIDVSSLPQGCYSLKVKGAEEQFYFSKFIKE